MVGVLVEHAHDGRHLFVQRRGPRVFHELDVPVHVQHVAAARDVAEVAFVTDGGCPARIPHHDDITLCFCGRGGIVDVGNEDVELARLQLLERIDQYEQLKRDTFMEAYTGINANFREIFHELSEGMGELLLENPDDPFAGGMILRAQPKEKTLQRIEAMSGRSFGSLNRARSSSGVEIGGAKRVAGFPRCVARCCWAEAG